MEPGFCLVESVGKVSQNYRIPVVIVNSTGRDYTIAARSVSVPNLGNIFKRKCYVHYETKIRHIPIWACLTLFSILLYYIYYLVYFYMWNRYRIPWTDEFLSRRAPLCGTAAPFQKLNGDEVY